MSVRELTPNDLDAIFNERIAPVLFRGESSADDPTLSIVTGSPGAGTARATGLILAESRGHIVVLSNEQLEGFHPDVLNAATVSDLTAVRDAAVVWSATAMRYARGSKRSLLIEGEGLSAAALVGTAVLFARDGYRTRAVIVSGGRAQTLLAVVSAYARDLRDGNVAVPVDVSAHDSARQNSRVVVSEIADAEVVDQLTILSHRGEVVFDGSRNGQKDPFEEAARRLEQAEAARMTPLESAEWMSELRRVTEFEMASVRPHPALVDGLIELHEIGLNDIVPKLKVPRGSAMVSRQEREYAARLVQLRRMHPPHEGSRELSAPVVAPPVIERDGIGR